MPRQGKRAKEKKARAMTGRSKGKSGPAPVMSDVEPDVSVKCVSEISETGALVSADESSPLTKSDIESAIRALGREPKAARVERLLSRRVTSARLQKILSQAPTTKRKSDRRKSETDHPRKSGPGPKLLGAGKPPIDVDASPELLQQLLSHVEGVWQGLGEERPYWSVLTGYEAEKFDARSKEKFYASGRPQVELFDLALTRAGVDRKSLHTCFELGCGVGRVTTWLADRFENVIGADISPPHIALAREAAKERGKNNIEFLHVAKMSVLENLPSFDAFFSVISLQHSPPPVMSFVLANILKRLSAGGVGYFQIPTQLLNYKFNAEAYLSDLQSHKRMEMNALPQKSLFEVIDASGCRVLEFRDDRHSGPTKLSNTILVQKVR
jgi:SAM-dependent methyltransferase